MQALVLLPCCAGSSVEHEHRRLRWFRHSLDQHCLSSYAHTNSKHPRLSYANSESYADGNPDCVTDSYSHALADAITGNEHCGPGA